MIAGLLSATILAACFGGTSNDVTASGESKPRVDASFPAQAEPGSRHTLVVHATNPGPGVIAPIVVSFSQVGVAGARKVPQPLVPVGVEGDNPVIVEIDPEPAGISSDAVTFTFNRPIPEGGEITIRFVVRAPERPGPYANAVIVGDGDEIERAAGSRVETTVER